ncbi:hypothetical protein ACHAXA_005596 [Cyclostephanos tholiformis]|uniref:riboflavin kinase n=1 Tax=Cyclostephanos tholiformis TaxID=382380 RepID=A0ABD3SGY8_9STRA
MRERRRTSSSRSSSSSSFVRTPTPSLSRRPVLPPAVGIIMIMIMIIMMMVVVVVDSWSFPQSYATATTTFVDVGGEWTGIDRLLRRLLRPRRRRHLTHAAVIGTPRGECENVNEHEHEHEYANAIVNDDDDGDDGGKTTMDAGTFASILDEMSYVRDWDDDDDDYHDDDCGDEPPPTPTPAKHRDDDATTTTTTVGHRRVLPSARRDVRVACSRTDDTRASYHGKLTAEEVWHYLDVRGELTNDGGGGGMRDIIMTSNAGSTSATTTTTTTTTRTSSRRTDVDYGGNRKVGGGRGRVTVAGDVTTLLDSSSGIDDDDDYDYDESTSSDVDVGEACHPWKSINPILRLRGNVASGYGRGGKKLGVPTANLPASLFQSALEEIPNGVYFGWAVVEDREKRGCRSDDDGIVKSRMGRDTPIKAVVNVGYSPTFEGKENKERIVEAHLITSHSPMTTPEAKPASSAAAKYDDEGTKNDVEGDVTASEIEGDFYNETMRLQLIGYLRPERKFDSFPELIAQIHRDIGNANWALDSMPFVLSKEDEFVKDGGVGNWIGLDGGDATASWEYESW